MIQTANLVVYFNLLVHIHNLAFSCHFVIFEVFVVSTPVSYTHLLLVMTPRKVIGVRDPRGIRPLVFGRKKNSMFFSSETCAFDELGVTFEREVEPGDVYKRQVLKARCVRFWQKNIMKGLRNRMMMPRV